MSLFARISLFCPTCKLKVGVVTRRAGAGWSIFLAPHTRRWRQSCQGSGRHVGLVAPPPPSLKSDGGPPPSPPPAEPPPQISYDDWVHPEPPEPPPEPPEGTKEGG